MHIHTSYRCISKEISSTGQKILKVSRIIRNRGCCAVLKNVHSTVLLIPSKKRLFTSNQLCSETRYFVIVNVNSVSNEQAVVCKIQNLILDFVISSYKTV